MSIVWGLIGLSLVVLVHEFGHFMLARMVGIEVEAFSVGFGPALLSHKGKRTEFRIAAFPLGGYCKLKGEEDFRKALDQNLAYIPKEEGSFYAASPLKRIVVASAGPLFNVLFAILVFILVAAIGTTIQTAPNRIILSSQTGSFLQPGLPNPADVAGLQTGDIIRAIDGKPIRDYSDLQEIIASNPKKTMTMEVERNGTILELVITPWLDPNTGAGVIGVYAWVDPVIESVQEKSPAALADLRPGDIIIAANDKPISNTVDLIQVFNDANGVIKLQVLRGAATIEVNLVAKSLEEAGMTFVSIVRTDKATSVPDAFVRGVKETTSTIALTFKSIGLLFKGVNVFKAVSGPARITYLIGNAATEQVKASGLMGLVPVLGFLAFISISLAIMNLLPMPVLDGGLILVFIIEALRRRPLTAKALYRYQFVGAAFVIVLFLVATLSDIFSLQENNAIGDLEKRPRKSKRSQNKIEIVRRNLQKKSGYRL